MPGIDSTDRLAAIIGAQVASMRRAPNRADNDKSSGTGKSNLPGLPSNPAALAAIRVKALQPDDPQRERKAFRIFLEAALVAELGTGLLADPAFSGMVDAVHREMESDPELSSAMSDAARYLLQNAR